ncbi:SLC13 family permease [Desulfovibrio sp. 86]|uniref:Citrate transporter n=1 Tax=uncultured Desulfovibrio sp. TaxID=167968 RepID=A0A212L296_9BACT|nr:SLC13 family permease [Desulfovibrio sp. 86]SCM71660.1 Citrate transporter [uncultured Desulfovibrio sp.]VZH33012.1 Citrate transporter [Desulfovibrio sp. 86]
MLTFDMAATLAILAGAVILLVTEVIRNDVIGILIVLALTFSGVLTVQESLSGFSSPTVIIISCMFIVGKAILHTGVAQRVGDFIIRRGGRNEKRLLTMIMGASASVGAFMSSTATAAIFIPITLAVAEKTRINPKRLLMPLAFASLISGMMTLVATTPNIIVNGILRERGAETLGFFSFTPFGIVILALAIGFMMLFGQNMLAPKVAPAEQKKGLSIDDLLRYHEINKSLSFLHIPRGSDLVDRSVARMQLSARFGITLLAVESAGQGRKRVITAAKPEMVLQAGDLLMLIGTDAQSQAFIKEFSLERVSAPASRRKSFFQVVGLAEVMLNPESSLIGKSLKETLFQTTFQSMVLGIRRKGKTQTEELADIPLKFGDVLLVCGAWADILRMERNKSQYLLLTLPQDYKEVVPAPQKEKVTLAILGVMVAAMASGLLPPVTAILAGTAALVLAYCAPMNSIYEVVDWQTVVMLAGILPLVLALQKTGLLSLASDGFIGLLSGSGPFMVLASLFLITAILGFFLSGTAVAVLVAPMAVDIGLKLGISPQACAMTVAIASSAVFVSPLGSAVHLLVRDPGGYVAKDYAKVGTPLLVLSLLATLALCWFFYLR